MVRRESRSFGHTLVFDPPTYLTGNDTPTTYSDSLIDAVGVRVGGRAPGSYEGVWIVTFGVPVGSGASGEAESHPAAAVGTAARMPITVIVLKYAYKATHQHNTAR